MIDLYPSTVPNHQNRKTCPHFRTRFGDSDYPFQSACGLPSLVRCPSFCTLVAILFFVAGGGGVLKLYVATVLSFLFLFFWGGEGGLSSQLHKGPRNTRFSTEYMSFLASQSYLPRSGEFLAKQLPTSLGVPWPNIMGYLAP